MEWGEKLWNAALVAGPFGNLGLTIIVVVLWGKLNKSHDQLASLTAAGWRAMKAYERTLAAIERRLGADDRRRRRKNS